MPYCSRKRRGATSTRIPGLLRETPFAVVDVETTGFSPLTGDRIVEVAVVRLEDDFTEEYVTLVNPLRDVGPVHVHGLTAEDVAAAPMFEEIVGDLLEVMRGAVMVAHNIRFERDFVSAEFSGAGVFLPRIPSLCTLELAYKMEPSLLNHRLASCCAAAGVPYYASHTALGDARAEADLLRRYLLRAEADGRTSLDSFGCVPAIFPSAGWPDLPRTGRRRARAGDGTGVAVPYLARLVASLGSVQTSEKLAPYMDLLDRVLEDNQVTEAEAEALRVTADQWGLSMEDVVAAHHAYLEALVTTAVADRRITGSERRELDAVSHLLAVDSSVLEALLVRGMEDRG